MEKRWEVGQEYFTVDGDRVYIYAVDMGPGKLIHGRLLAPHPDYLDDWIPASWVPSGKVFTDGQHGHDLTLEKWTPRYSIPHHSIPHHGTSSKIWEAYFHKIHVEGQPRLELVFIPAGDVTHRGDFDWMRAPQCDGFLDNGPGSKNTA